MYFGSTISALIREGCIVGLWDFRSGSAKDWGSYGTNGGILSSGCRFTGPSGALRFPAVTDEVTVADAPELRLTAGSIVAVAGQGGFVSQVNYERIYHHYSGTKGFTFAVHAGIAVFYYDGPSTCSVATSVLGERSLGVTFQTGATPLLYKSGVFSANFSGNVTVTAWAGISEIGNRANSANLRSSLDAILVANRILTPTEMAQVHAELVAAKWPAKQVAIARRVQGSVIGEAGLVAGWSMRPVGGAVVDVVGAHNGTIYGSVARQGILGYEQTFDGTDDYIDCGNVGSVKTLAFWCRPTTTTEDIADMDGGTHTVEVGAGTLTATGWNAPTIYVNGAASTALRAGVLQRVVITTATAFNATALQLGTETTFFDGQIGEVEVFSDEKSSAWVAADYAEGAKAVQFKTDWGYSISPADEGGVTGQQIGGDASPFRAGDATGRWAVETDTIEGRLCKVLTCKTAGLLNTRASFFHAATPTECAFGSWEFYGYKANASAFDANIIATLGTGITTGYGVRWAADESVVLYEYGVGNVIAGGTASHSAWHRFRVTRSLVGLFTLYIDGVAVGTGTDITTLTATYMVFDMDAGDKIALGDVGGNSGIVKMLGVVAP